MGQITKQGSRGETKANLQLPHGQRGAGGVAAGGAPGAGIRAASLCPAHGSKILRVFNVRPDTLSPAQGQQHPSLTYFLFYFLVSLLFPFLCLKGCFSSPAPAAHQPLSEQEQQLGGIQLLDPKLNVTSPSLSGDLI